MVWNSFFMNKRFKGHPPGSISLNLDLKEWVLFSPASIEGTEGLDFIGCLYFPYPQGSVSSQRAVGGSLLVSLSFLYHTTRKALQPMFGDPHFKKVFKTEGSDHRWMQHMVRACLPKSYFSFEREVVKGDSTRWKQSIITLANLHLSILLPEKLMQQKDLYKETALSVPLLKFREYAWLVSIRL